MDFRFTERGEHDLAQIIAHLKQHSPMGAKNVQRSINDTIDALCVLPKSGRNSPWRGIRQTPIRKYPYLILYRYDEDHEMIVIQTIFHTSQSDEKKRP